MCRNASLLDIDVSPHVDEGGGHKRINTPQQTSHETPRPKTHQMIRLSTRPESRNNRQRVVRLERRVKMSLPISPQRIPLAATKPPTSMLNLNRTRRRRRLRRMGLDFCAVSPIRRLSALSIPPTLPKVPIRQVLHCCSTCGCPSNGGGKQGLT